MIVLNNKYYGKFILLSKVKKHLLLAIILCFFIITGNAQEWVNICPSFDQPGNYNMSLGTFVDENNGWFTEMFPGRTWCTQDGGLTWNMQIDSSAVWSYNIEFFNCKYGWILGKRISNYVPFLKRTTDGGENWETLSLPSEFGVIEFIDSLAGFSEGESAIYRTTDGGESWEEQYVDREIVEPFTDDTVTVWFGLSDIFFLYKQYGWAVGGRADITDCGIILNTVDGGETWHVQAPRTQVLYSVYFSDRLHGCAVGPNLWYGGVIMLTEDGGETWRENLPGIPWLNDVVLMDDSIGWVVGDYGYIGYTEDGGQTWEQVESGTHADLHRIEFVENGQVGYIFGEYNTLLKYDRSNNSIKGNIPDLPKRFELFQNYPNPFNLTTNINFIIPNQSKVSLRIYNILGEEVAALANNEVLEAGQHRITWNAADLPSGVYFYHLEVAGQYSSIKKCVLMK